MFSVCGINDFFNSFSGSSSHPENTILGFSFSFGKDVRSLSRAVCHRFFWPISSVPSCNLHLQMYE